MDANRGTGELEARVLEDAPALLRVALKCMNLPPAFKREYEEAVSVKLVSVCLSSV